MASQLFEVRSIDGFMLVTRLPNNPTDEEISAGGDSGSLWCDDKNGDAVGLHFAGEVSEDRQDEFAIACNMTSVTRELNVRLATAEDLLNEDDSIAGATVERRDDVPSETPRANVPPTDLVDLIISSYERGKLQSGRSSGAAAASVESAPSFSQLLKIFARAIGFDPRSVDPKWPLAGKPLFLDEDGKFDLADDINDRLRAAGFPQRVTRDEMRKSKTAGDVIDAARS